MKPTSYDSPEKRRVRTELWLPHVKESVHRALADCAWREPKYLTFPGPECLDLRFFIDRERLFKKENVLAFEVKEENAGLIMGNYPGIAVARCPFEEIATSRKFDHKFPFDVVNLDFDGNFFDNGKGGIPRKLKAIERALELQASWYTSFDMFVTFESSYQEGRPASDRDVAKILFDHASRLGFNEGYFGLASKGLRRNYERSMLQVFPSIIIRMGWEHGFDTRLHIRACYRPSRPASRAVLVCFVFGLTWSYAPLSLPLWEWGSTTSETIAKRQQEALSSPVLDLSKHGKSSAQHAVSRTR
jgi:hypothetical protein